MSESSPSPFGVDTPTISAFGDLGSDPAATPSMADLARLIGTLRADHDLGVLRILAAIEEKRIAAVANSFYSVDFTPPEVDVATTLQGGYILSNNSFSSFSSSPMIMHYGGDVSFGGSDRLKSAILDSTVGVQSLVKATGTLLCATSALSMSIWQLTGFAAINPVISILLFLVGVGAYIMAFMRKRLARI